VPQFQAVICLKLHNKFLEHRDLLSDEAIHIKTINAGINSIEFDNGALSKIILFRDEEERIL